MQILLMCVINDFENENSNDVYWNSIKTNCFIVVPYIKGLKKINYNGIIHKCMEKSINAWENIKQHSTNKYDVG